MATSPKFFTCKFRRTYNRLHRLTFFNDHCISIRTRARPNQTLLSLPTLRDITYMELALYNFYPRLVELAQH